MVYMMGQEVFPLLMLFPQSCNFGSLLSSNLYLFPFYHLIMQEATHVEIARVQEPLPENEFVVQARDNILGPRARIITATTRGRGRGRTTRGRGMGDDQGAGRGRSRAGGQGRGRAAKRA
jgi:hypothetical protein